MNRKTSTQHNKTAEIKRKGEHTNLLYQIQCAEIRKGQLVQETEVHKIESDNKKKLLLSQRERLEKEKVRLKGSEDELKLAREKLKNTSKQRIAALEIQSKSESCTEQELNNKRAEKSRLARRFLTLSLRRCKWQQSCKTVPQLPTVCLIPFLMRRRTLTLFKRRSTPCSLKTVIWFSTQKSIKVVVDLNGGLSKYLEELKVEKNKLFDLLKSSTEVYLLLFICNAFRGNLSERVRPFFCIGHSTALWTDCFLTVKVKPYLKHI